MNKVCDLGNDVARAARLLRDGGLVAIATETVYGLGANALNETAVAKVFAAKNRPHFDPLIVHIADEAWLKKLVAEWPDAARQLAARFWPGPLTLVVPKTSLVPDLVTSGLPSVAIRMPAHPQALEVLRLADVPVAAPSANPFGRLSPTRAEDVAEQLGDRIDYILDGGPCRVGIESTVVQIAGDQITLLRPGGVSLEELESVVGKVAVPKSVGHTVDRANATSAAPAPGMLPQHYAPRTPLTLIDCVDEAQRTESAGLLTLLEQPSNVTRSFAAVEVLSATGDLVEAAANFFSALRKLDKRNLKQIYALRLPTEGLGLALNDRLTRAAFRTDDQHSG